MRINVSFTMFHLDNKSFIHYIIVITVSLFLGTGKLLCQDIKFLKKEYEAINQSGNDSLIYVLSKKIAFKSSNPEEKLFYAEKALRIGEKFENFHWQASAKFCIGVSYVRLGNLEEAINKLLESIDLYKKVNSFIGIATVKDELAEIYRQNGDYELAERTYIESLQIFNQERDTIRLASSQLNLGEFYRTINRKEEAVNLYLKALKNYKNLNYYYGIAYAQGNIGLVYTTLNKLDSAEIYLNKSIEILEPLGNNYAVSSYLDGLAEVHFKRKHYTKARQTALKSLHLAQEHGLKEQIRDASLRLSSIYNQSKEFEKAFFHHKQYVAYRDSINNEETIRKIANLHTKYEVAQKQKEVDIEKAQKDRYLIVAIAATSVLIVLIILVFIVLKISRFRRKVNQKLKEQSKELTKANATKNKFFSILSHDLRSPLATYHGYSEVLNLCVEHNEYDKIVQISTELQSSSANMLNLLDNLLQWGVNQMDSVESKPTYVKVKDVVLMEIRHLQNISNKKNIEVKAIVPQDIILFVDRGSMAMAIRNLVSNAIKYTPSGGVIIVSAHNENAQTIIKIKDSGVGMTPEQKDKLFTFIDINSTYGTQNEKGVGLGLRLVCGFIKAHQAQIDVESELGKGTTFILTFDKDKQGEGECG